MSEDIQPSDARHAIVIGAGPGIGASAARRFAREGCRMTLVARNRERLDGLAAELRDSGASVDVRLADVAEPAGYRTVLEDIAATSAGPGIVLFNAAMLQPTNLLTVSVGDLLTGYSVDVVGAVLAAQVFVPAMRAAGAGTLLLTGGSAAVRPSPGIATVSLGKAALRSAGIMLDADLRDAGIHVTSITVSGAVRQGTPFDPDLIADLYWRLHQQPASEWTAEVPFDGA